MFVLNKTPDKGTLRDWLTTDSILLALKVMAEKQDRQVVTDERGVAVGKVDAAIENGCDRDSFFPLLDLYHSPTAERYRLGPEECRGCKIRP